MDTASTSTMQDKQITIDVPGDRVAEFYAVYARFLAGRTRGRWAGGRGRRHGHGHGHGCVGRHTEDRAEPTADEVRSV